MWTWMRLLYVNHSRSSSPSSRSSCACPHARRAGLCWFIVTPQASVPAPGCYRVPCITLWPLPYMSSPLMVQQHLGDRDTWLSSCCPQYMEQILALEWAVSHRPAFLAHHEAPVQCRSGSGREHRPHPRVSSKNQSQSPQSGNGPIPYLCFQETKIGTEEFLKENGIDVFLLLL